MERTFHLWRILKFRERQKREKVRLFATSKIKELKIDWYHTLTCIIIATTKNRNIIQRQTLPHTLLQQLRRRSKIIERLCQKTQAVMEHPDIIFNTQTQNIHPCLL